MKRNALLISYNTQGIVTNGMVFKVNHTDYYKVAFEEIKHKLENIDTVQYIVDMNENVDVRGYKFTGAFYATDLPESEITSDRNSDILFAFKNETNEVKYIGVSADFVYIAE